MRKSLLYVSKVMAAGAALGLFRIQVPYESLPEAVRHPFAYEALAFGTSFAATTDLRATLTAFLIGTFVLSFAPEEENGTQEEEGGDGA